MGNDPKKGEKTKEMKKRIVSLLTVAVMLLCAVTTLVGCVPRERTIKILSWADYIDYGDKDEGTLSIMKQFEADYLAANGVKVKVVYDTVSTNEDMYKKINTNKADYDLICPSDYMIEKMYNEGLLNKIVKQNVPNYWNNVSPYILDLATNSIGQSEKAAPAGVDINEYFVGYMWGTMGILYNENKLTAADKSAGVSSWNILWDDNAAYKSGIYMKDSIRDTYLVAAIKTNTLSSVNNPSATNISAIETALKEQKRLSSFKGYEVDQGKNDMLIGNAAMCVAWAGDAAWAISESDENLKYAVPDEGSNVFFDGFVIPKYSKNQAMAEEFLNYLCSSEIAIRNMDYIGYTSVIATKELFEAFNDNGDDNNEEIDVSYFFIGGEGDDNDYTAARLNIIQYPSQEILNRCVVMRDFGSATQAITEMWNRVKAA
jgi:spermidine/putrescine transport system substrate-binding protein